MPSAEAVAEAKRLAAGAGKPIVLADTQDNPGGGGHGDTTELLAELVRQGANGALVCLINDAESAAACHAAGEGATVSLSLGGKSDGMPFACSARVLKLTDGRFTLTGPMGAGNPANLGPSALIDIDGVRVIVASRKMQALDQAIIRHVGVEPADCPILALKSSVHFRADFTPIAERIIVAIAPGTGGGRPGNAELPARAGRCSPQAEGHRHGGLGPLRVTTGLGPIGVRKTGRCRDSSPSPCGRGMGEGSCELRVVACTSARSARAWRTSTGRAPSCA